MRTSKPLIESVLGSDVELVLNLIEGETTVTANRGNFVSMLINMAQNSRDAIAGQGRFSIRVSVEKVDATKANEQRIRSGEFVRLEVADNGSGVPPDILDTIFEPYVTTKPSRGRYGLGLISVYGFVRQSGGFIEVASQLDHGTTFSIYFPVSVISSNIP